MVGVVEVQLSIGTAGTFGRYLQLGALQSKKQARGRRSFELPRYMQPGNAKEMQMQLHLRVGAPGSERWTVHGVRKHESRPARYGRFKECPTVLGPT